MSLNFTKIAEILPVVTEHSLIEILRRGKEVCEEGADIEYQIAQISHFHPGNPRLGPLYARRAACMAQLREVITQVENFSIAKEGA